VKQIRNRTLPALILCIALLAALCGCQKKGPLDQFPFDDESLSYLESLYGIDAEEAMEELGFSEKDITGKVLSIWFLDQSTVIKGKEFTKSVQMDFNTERLRGVGFTCYCDSAEETADLAEALYRDAVEEYKGRSDNFLSNEGIFDEMREATNDSWYEYFETANGLTRVEMRVYILDGYFSVQLYYYVGAENWHQFQPEE